MEASGRYLEGRSVVPPAVLPRRGASSRSWRSMRFDFLLLNRATHSSNVRSENWLRPMS